MVQSSQNYWNIFMLWWNEPYICWPLSETTFSGRELVALVTFLNFISMTLAKTVMVMMNWLTNTYNYHILVIVNQLVHQHKNFDNNKLKENVCLKIKKRRVNNIRIPSSQNVDANFVEPIFIFVKVSESKHLRKLAELFREPHTLSIFVSNCPTLYFV